MKTSREYKDSLKRKFKFSKTIWTSSEGISYIGYNHTVKAQEEYLQPITKKEASLIFNRDILIIERFLNRNLTRTIPQRHFDIMVSLCYDIGSKALKNSNFFNLYLAGDIESSFKYFMIWSKRNGELVQSLYLRRKEELHYINYNIQGI